MIRKSIILPRRSAVKKNEVKRIFTIAIAWTVIDFLIFIIRSATDNYTPKYESTAAGAAKTILLRELNVFIFSLIIGYFLVGILKYFLRNRSLWLNLVTKTLLLVIIAIAMNFFIYFTYSLLIEQRPVAEAFTRFVESTFRQKWLGYQTLEHCHQQLRWQQLFIWWISMD